jgi:hypothetical protein
MNANTNSQQAMVESLESRRMFSGTTAPVYAVSTTGCRVQMSTTSEVARPSVATSASGSTISNTGRFSSVNVVDTGATEI